VAHPPTINQEQLGGFNPKRHSELAFIALNHFPKSENEAKQVNGNELCNPIGKLQT